MGPEKVPTRQIRYDKSIAPGYSRLARSKTEYKAELEKILTSKTILTSKKILTPKKFKVKILKAIAFGSQCF